jgi:hypothetical protein
VGGSHRLLARASARGTRTHPKNDACEAAKELDMSNSNDDPTTEGPAVGGAAGVPGVSDGGADGGADGGPVDSGAEGTADGGAGGVPGVSDGGADGGADDAAR